MGEHLPVILIEVVLVFGGVLVFAWWQLRSVARDRREAAARAAVRPQPVPADTGAGGATVPGARTEPRAEGGAAGQHPGATVSSSSSSSSSSGIGPGAVDRPPAQNTDKPLP